MDKVVYFKNDGLKKDYCTGQTYSIFLDYAFSKADYFMLVYVDYYGNGYTQKQKYYRDSLKKFEVKNRSNPSWPGTLRTFCSDTTYKVVFYKAINDAKKILKQVNSLSDWSRLGMPQDLAFFKGNRCWFYSVGHEKIGAIIHADADDLDFLEMNNLAKREDAFDNKDDYFDAYDEDIE